jgi:hypothetical protein
MTRYDCVYCDAGHSVLSGFNFLVLRFGIIWKVQGRNTRKYLTRSAAFFAIGAGVTRRLRERSLTYGFAYCHFPLRLGAGRAIPTRRAGGAATAFRTEIDHCVASQT